LSPRSNGRRLGRLAIGDVWGIGRRWAALLEGRGIATALTFSEQQDGWIREHLNIVALRTATELRGTPCLPLELAPPPRKALVVSRMFGRKLADFEPVKEALIAYVSRAAEKLRRDKLLARHMQVFLHNSPFAVREAYFSNTTGLQLPYPTSDTAELIGHATAALRRIYRPDPHYAKCGVMLTELSPEGVGQADLFDGRDSARRRELMAALDAINRRMGRDTVFYAGSGLRRDWKAFANRKSQHFTTDWRQMMRVKA
jgi:DNA polymerase V